MFSKALLSLRSMGPRTTRGKKLLWFLGTAAIAGSYSYIVYKENMLHKFLADQLDIPNEGAVLSFEDDKVVHVIGDELLARMRKYLPLKKIAAKKGAKDTVQRTEEEEECLQLVKDLIQQADDKLLSHRSYDMTQPLSHYFISSSHNTYLLGNQWNSDSSPLAYKYALLNNCRCLEIDCWDGQGGEPIVTHGHTQCSKISFESVLKGIKQFAFTTTEYPLILSLEVHCSVPQQVKMARYLREVFGDQLMFYKADVGHSLPSPEEAKGKVILQGELAATEYKMKQLYYDILTDLFSAEQELTVDAVMKQADKVYDTVVHTIESTGTQQEPKDKIGKWSKELYDLIMFRAIPYDQREKEFFHEQKYLYNNFTMLNMSEGYLHAKIKSHPELFVDQNDLRLTRVYPKATRLLSSNFNPQFYWLHGCQLASLNYQCHDSGMRVNTGFFAAYPKQTGYVLKPQFDREQGENRLDSTRITILEFMPNYQCKKWREMSQLNKMSCAAEMTSNSSPWKLDKISKKLLQGFEDQTFEIKHNQQINQIPIVSFGLFKKRALFYRLIPRSENQHCLAYNAVPAQSLQEGLRYIPIKDRDGVHYGGFLVYIEQKLQNR